MIILLILSKPLFELCPLISALRRRRIGLSQFYPKTEKPKNPANPVNPVREEAFS
jgi:hypothetical protein